LHTVSVWGPEVQSMPATEAHAAAPQASRLRTRLGLGGACVVMYSGNAGIVHEFGPILEAMRRLNEDAGVYFLFVGGGPRRSEIEAFARTHVLRNFSYQPYVPLADLADALATGDIHLITLRAPFAGISVPGKLYGIMGAARPALFVGPPQCETADAIGDAACGVVVDATDTAAADQIVSAIRAWRDDPSVARAAGARGHAAYADRFQQDPNCRAFARVLAAEWPATCGAPKEGWGDSDAETDADASLDRSAAAMPPAPRGSAARAASVA
jgi:colanic acid biosynthesis glycosyl transferase WcaI